MGHGHVRTITTEVCNARTGEHAGRTARPSSTSARVIVSIETGGLGNRIKSWVSAMRLDADARVYWPVTENMPAPFDRLFANSCAVDSLPAGAQVYKSWRLAILPEDTARLPRNFAVVGSGTHPVLRGVGKLWWRVRGAPDDRYRYMLFPKQHSRRSTRRDGRDIDLEYGRIPEVMRRAYLPYFSRISIQPSIGARVDAWSKANLDADVIGVQVRTWRDYPRRYRKYHLPAQRRLVELMRTAALPSRFLVVSDSDEIIDLLAEKLGPERVLSFPRDTPRHASWQAPEGIIEDLIDMLLLARTHRLFASYLSTFSETAWWLGGAGADVTVF